MESKEYMRPTIDIVELRMETQLLRGSTGQGGFGDDGPTEEDMD